MLLLPSPLLPFPGDLNLLTFSSRYVVIIEGTRGSARIIFFSPGTRDGLSIRRLKLEMLEPLGLNLYRQTQGRQILERRWRFRVQALSALVCA